MCPDLMGALVSMSGGLLDRGKGNYVPTGNSGETDCFSHQIDKIQ